MAEDQNPPADEQDKNNNERKRPGKKPLIILGIVVVVMVVVALVWWFLTRNEETTDDAFTDGDVVTIAPKTAGYVTELRVRDNQRVKKGDLLVVIDPRDTTAQRDQAQAQLGLAIAQLHQAQAQLALSRVQYPAQRDEARAQVLKAQADLANAQAEYRRQRGVDPRATTQQSIDSANAQLRSAQAALASAQAQLDVAIQQYNANQAMILGTSLENQPAVQQAATEVRNAWLALQRTKIVSPMTGYVSRRSVQPGAQISTTTPLMAVVPANNLWVDANFKETQLAHMRIGQTATVVSDIYGDDIKYTGKVVGLDMGTGSAFSLLPAQNATGNWIKVVQRLPVRIELDPKQLADHPLRIGLSTLVTVDTANRDGQILASQVRSSPAYESNAREISLDPVNKLIDDIVKANAG